MVEDFFSDVTERIRFGGLDAQDPLSFKVYDPDRIVLGKAHQNSNAPDPLGLLRPRHKRPCRRAADKRDELAPLHVPPQTSEGHRSGSTRKIGRAR